MVVTGHGTVDTAIQALREGASGMLVKPFTGEELLAEVRRALSAAQMRYEALQYRYLSPVLDSIALTLSTAIEARNLETGEHCRQLGVLSERMAAVLGSDERQQMTIRIGGYLHDIGKIGIADAVLLKPGPADRRGDGRDAPPQRDRGRDPRGPRGDGRHRPDRPPPPRALGRPRLPRRAGRRRHPAGRPDHRRGRRLQRHDQRPHLPAGAADGPGLGRAARPLPAPSSIRRSSPPSSRSSTRRVASGPR